MLPCMPFPSRAHWDGLQGDAVLKLGVSRQCCHKFAGMIKNWWAGVEALHNLFVKEHNHICKMLRKVGYPYHSRQRTSNLLAPACSSVHER